MGTAGVSLMEEAMSLGDLVKSSVMQTLSAVAGGAVQAPAAAGPAAAPESVVEAPRSLDEMFADRVALSLRSGSTLPDAQSEDGEGSVCSQDSQGSSVQLLDGTEACTDAMARFMRRGHGELECHVCMQLFTSPVKPAAGGCRCTVCEACFVNLVQFSAECPKCHKTLPSDPRKFIRNPDMQRAIEALQQAGGEDAEHARMMSDLRAEEARARSYQRLAFSELHLDPDPIAKGAYGSVYKGVWVPHGIQVAVKKINGTNVMSEDQSALSFQNEINILSMLDHPHVLKLFGAVIEDDNVCIVTELVPGGSLFDLIHTKPLLKSEAVIVIGAGVCKGMTYLHSMSVIHRDLKPGNLLMSAVQSPSGPQLIVKVADFGLARVQDTARTMTGGIGTSQYTAPEVLRSERYDNKVDVFSFGVILWEIHAQKLPYTNMNAMQIAVAVATQDYRPPAPPNCPEPFRELMEECWHPRPKQRPTFPQVLSQLEDMQYVFSLAAGCSLKTAAAHGQPRRDGAADGAAGGGGGAEGGGGGGGGAGGGKGGGGAFFKTMASEDQKEALVRRAAEERLKRLKEPVVAPSAPGSSMDVEGGGAAPAAAARVLRVPSEHPTIAAAVAAARDGDRIKVAAGRYQESLRLTGLSVEISGEGGMQVLRRPAAPRPARAALAGALTAGAREQGLLVQSPDGQPVLTSVGGAVLLRQLMLKGSGPAVVATAGGAHGGSLTLEDCYVSGSRCGLVLRERAVGTLRRSVLCKCGEDGIQASGGGAALVESCSIFDNARHGVVVSGRGSSVRISRSMLSNNGGAGVAVDQEGGGRVEDNDLRNNALGPCVVGEASKTRVAVGSNLT